MPECIYQIIETIRKRAPYKLWIPVILLQVFSFSHLFSQCTSSGPITIPDDDTIVFQLSVTGLIDGNLASPTQGICGVEIDFMHEYLGDLTMILVSPSGTMVTLIGPNTTTTGATNLVHWDVGFIPCATTASPDGSFTAQWSNAQPWPTIGFFDGTYHPQDGCLEDFNSGPANGLWQFIIQDHDQNQIGSIATITLIFCNPDGLQCQCNPNAGVLFPTSFSICSGENIQSSSINVDFGGYVPPPSLYQYEYLLVTGNSILQSGTSFSATPAVGNYSICGLSYLIEDTAAINSLLSAGSYSDLVQAINSGSVCAQLTSSCIAVQVQNKPDTIVANGNLCNGELFSYGGQNYFAPGIYYQVHDGPSLCDTIHEIRISARILTVVINDPDTLSCGSGDVDMAAIVSGATGPYFYQWTTGVGNITSSPTSSMISANQAGQYFVSVTDGICEGSGSTIVHADQGYPQVIVEGGTITCYQPTIDLNPIYIPIDGITFWTGPSGFTSALPNITVSIPGTYILHVTNRTGCTTSKSVEIAIDTLTHPTDIIVINKDCQNQLITLGNSILDNNQFWSWTGPNNFSSDYWRPAVSDAGTYTLTLTFLNGCQRTSSYFFDGDFIIPDIMTSPDDTIHCNDVLALQVSSNTTGSLFGWTGPLGFSSGLSVIIVNHEGTYTGSVLAPNGCRNSDDVNIALGADIFTYQTFTDTLNCSKDSVSIGIISSDADVFDWLNYSGPDDANSSIKVGVAGIYSVMMTDTNTGCTIIAEIQVISDYRYTDFGYLTDTITCLNPVATLSFIPFQGYTYSKVYWELPDLSVVQGPVLMSGLPGEHRLFAESPNGCVGVWLINIPFDTIPPFLLLESDTIGCEDTVQIISQTLDSIVNYQWSGPGIIAPGQSEIGVNEPGWYHLSAFGQNGCPSEYDVYVDSNFILPTYQLMADSLRCNRPAFLSVTTTDSVLSYAWLNSFGQTLSNDSSVHVTQPGLYYFEIRGLNNCPAYDTINMLDLQYPIVSLFADSITCEDSISQISIETDVLQYTVAWLDLNGDTFSLSPSLDVTDEGPYIASVSGENGCPSLDTILIPIDTIPPQAIIEPIGEIRCQMRDMMLDASSSSPVPLLYVWTTSGGNLLSDPSSSMVEVRDTGLYVIEVTRLDNGCIDVDSIILMEVPDAITSAELDITPAQCSGDENASVEITGLQGGVLPVQYQLNTGPPQVETFFDDLPPGTYDLTITDAENCIYDTTFVILQTGPYTVDAGPDQEIYIGETLQLTGFTDLDVDDVLTYTWLSSHDTICTNCPGIEISPLETATFTFQVQSNTGCIKSDEVIIYVIQKAKYYVPNIFSPNGDGINDELRIHPSPGIVKILQWIIFDRWGNAVYGKTDFDPGDPSVFWDGQASTGEFLNPGVFPYLIEFQLVNGKIELYHGSITLLR